MEEEALFYRLGDNNLKLLLDRFYDLVFVNEVIGDLFKIEKNEIKRKQYLFLTQFLGGPARYTEEFGHPKLRARHMPHPITEDGAVAWLKCMHEAIQTLDVADEIKKELFNRFPKSAFFMVNQS
jgi:hemoglobin